MNKKKKKNLLDEWLNQNTLINKDDDDSRDKNFYSSKTKKNTIIPEIDLHGFTVKEALSKLKLFIFSQSAETKQIRIIHGKGRHSKEKHSVLKTQIRDYLKKLYDQNKIKDFRYETPQLGGTGATLVWLRK